MKLYRLLFSILLWLIGISSSLAQLSKPGITLQRTLGHSAFQYRIDPSGSGVLCKYVHQDSIIAMVYLNSDTPQTKIEFEIHGEKGVCELNLRFPNKKTDITQLTAHIQVGANDPNENFDGLLAAWLAGQSESRTLDSLVYQLTPVISILVIPEGEAKNSAKIAIYEGSLLAYSVVLTQTAPTVTLNSAIIIGDTKIESGMQLILQIPTKLQSGSIRLNTVFSSSIIPPTHFNALVATWGL